VSADKFLYRHWGKILFCVNFFLGVFILWQGRKLGLFAPPRLGMDQHTILESAHYIAFCALFCGGIQQKTQYLSDSSADCRIF
jgi:hypothetical protein